MARNDLFQHSKLLRIHTMLHSALNDATSVTVRREQFDVRHDVVDDELHLIRKGCCRQLGIFVAAIVRGSSHGKSAHYLDGPLDDVIAIGVVNEGHYLIVELGHQLAYLLLAKASNRLLDDPAAVHFAGVLWIELGGRMDPKVIRSFLQQIHPSGMSHTFLIYVEKLTRAYAYIMPRHRTCKLHPSNPSSFHSIQIRIGPGA